MTDSTHISTHFQGKNRILTIWPEGAITHDGDGKKKTSFDVASSMETELQRLERRLQAVEHDDRLSPKGKKDKRADEQYRVLLALSAQMERLDNDAHVSEKIERMQVEEAIGQRSKDDVRGTLIDLAVAEQLRGMDSVKMTASLSTDSMDEAELYAAATLPRILTGLTEDQVNRARTNAVYRHNPGQAAINQVDNESRQAAYNALRKAYQLASDGLPREKRKQAGEQMFRRFDSTVSVEGMKDSSEAAA